MGEDDTNQTIGLHVVYGSRTRRGLSHPNEDRHSVVKWTSWNADAHSESNDKESNYPHPTIVIPSCIGSARKDTTISGSGATGGAQDPFTEMMIRTDGTGSASVPSSAQNAYLWTVCDGHDGPEAADFVCQHVGEAFSKTWHLNTTHKVPSSVIKEKNIVSGEDLKTYARGYALSNALARTFEGLDWAFKAHTNPENSESGARVPGSTAGSCVTSIFLNGNLMCCAGLGDCKAAILTLEEAEVALPSNSASKEEVVATANTKHAASSDGAKPNTTSKASQQQFQVTWFSKEHRSSCPKERARIRARGGWFRLHRVGGVLEPTRTIGDFDVKASQPPGVVISTPEVRTFTVTKPALVLIASDGVWDVMDASQLLRTLKKRRRLWRGVLSWLGAQIPERRSILTFGFRRRAKSKEGFEAMLQMPTGGDLVAMAETLVTRAHDLGSDDDCTCVCIYLRPALRASTPDSVNEKEGACSEESERDSKEEYDEEEDLEYLDEDEFDEEGGEEEDEEEDDDREEEEERVDPTWPDSGHEYEKWRKSDDEENSKDPEDDPAEESNPEVEENVSKEADEWKLPSAIFPVSFYASTGVHTGFDAQDDPPGVAEKARKRSEERRIAREKRRRSLEKKHEHQPKNPL